MAKKKRKHRPYDAVREADNALQKAVEEEVSILYPAVAIALHRYWGWGQKRICDLLELTGETWHECGRDNNKSMPQMLQDETGIIVQNGDGTNWTDKTFLNVDVELPWSRKLARAQWVAMRTKQLAWVRPNVTAAIFLSLHRKCGFAGVRCQRLMNQIEVVQEEYGRNKDALKAACINETGVSVIDHLAQKEMEVAE